MNDETPMRIYFPGEKPQGCADLPAAGRLRPALQVLHGGLYS